MKSIFVVVVVVVVVVVFALPEFYFHWGAEGKVTLRSAYQLKH